MGAKRRMDTSTTIVTRDVIPSEAPSCRAERGTARGFQSRAVPFPSDRALCVSGSGWRQRSISARKSGTAGVGSSLIAFSTANSAIFSTAQGKWGSLRLR